MQNLLEKLKLGDGPVSFAVWIGLGILLVIVVIALAMWLVRLVRPTFNMSGGGARGGRPQRLAVTDAFNLDREGRKLVIIRRDNVEHLLLIGGPNDVVIEPNIMRSERMIRERGRGESGEAGAIIEHPAPPEPRAQTQPPLGPAPSATPNPPPRPTPAPAKSVAPSPAMPSNPMPASPAMAQAPEPAPSAAPSMPTKFDDEFEQALLAMQSTQAGRGKTSAPAAMAANPPMQQSAAMPSPAASAPAMQPAPAASAPAMMPSPTMQPAPPAMSPPATMAAPSIPPAAAMPPTPPANNAAPRREPVSEMARRLNEVLQKPLSTAAKPVPRAEAAAPSPVPAPPPPPPQPVSGTGSPAEMDLLEEEMARLLGRPPQPRKPGQ